MKQILFGIRKLFEAFRNIFILANNTYSYYPNFSHKTNLHKYFDLLKWLFKYGEVNKYYYLYGFDIEKKNNIDMNQYMDYRHFIH